MNWPCIIKYAGDAELVYVTDQTQWDEDVDLHQVIYGQSDILIDSSGEIYSLETFDGQRVEPRPLGETMTLQAVIDLVRNHAAQQGSCCVAKLYATTLEEAFSIVASLLNNQ